MKITKNILIFFVCLCGVSAAQAQSFPYPAIPQMLRTAGERGAWLLEHYWDNFSFRDTTVIHKPDLTEQGFANFLDLLPRMDSIAAERGVEAFTARAVAADTVPENVRRYFIGLAERYLYDPNSPMRSDALYAIFLRHFAAHPSAFDAAGRERNAYTLRNITKNQVGTVATDFKYVDRQGRRRTLLTTPGEYTLLYFHDPDCDNCHEITSMLARDSLFTDNPRLTVIAVYADADTGLWRKEPQPFPKSWIDAYSPDGEINAKQLYFIRATPTMYLLDRNKRVVLKDPSPEMIIFKLKSKN